MEKLIEGIGEYEEELLFRYREKEQELIKKVQEAEVFGMMKEAVIIAQNIIDTGLLEDDVVANITGLSVQHVVSLHR